MFTDVKGAMSQSYGTEEVEKHFFDFRLFVDIL